MMRIVRLVLSVLFTAALVWVLPAERAAAQNVTSDGPYLLYPYGANGEASEIRVLGMSGDSLIEQRYRDSTAGGGDDGPGPFRTFEYEGTSYPRSADRVRPLVDLVVSADRAARVLAISDLHGEFDHLVRFLREAGVVDSGLHWNWGDGRLVVVGDIFDRGSRVTECLWLLYRLQIEALQGGGRVHVLLGNHELMVMRGDLRYVNEKYSAGIVERTGMSYSELYGSHSELGRWLRNLNTAMRINDLLFVHGGIAPWLAESGLTLEQINDSARAGIDLAKDALSGRPFLHRLYGTDGPFWYRGYHYAMEEKYPAATRGDVDAVLARFGAAACVVGHTEVDSLTTLLDGRVIAVDVPVDELGGLEGLLWENGEVFRVTGSGRRVPLVLDRWTKPGRDED